MIAEMAARHIMPIFWVIAEKHVNGPQFCTTKLSKLSDIWSEHQAGNDARQIAARFRGRILQFLVNTMKLFWCVELLKNPYGWILQAWLPMKFIRLIMEVLTISICKPLLDDRHNAPMMKSSHFKYLVSWIRMLPVKGNLQGNRVFLPSSIHVTQPECPVAVRIPKLFVEEAPLGVFDVFHRKIWIFEDL